MHYQLKVQHTFQQEYFTVKSVSVFRSGYRQNVGQRNVSHNLSEKERTFAVGDQLHGYIVERIVPVPELSLIATYLRHRTGAQHLHIARQDSDNVFG